MNSILWLAAAAVAGAGVADMSGTRTGRRLGALIFLTAIWCLLTGAHW